MLKKMLVVATVTIIGVSSLLIVSLFFLLQSRYSASIINIVFERLTPYTITTQQASYLPPYQFTFEDVEINGDSQPIQIPKLSLWISPTLWTNQKLSLDSILIEEANLNFEALNSPLLKSVNTKQLALQNVDIHAANWSARDVNIQIQQPEWRSPRQTIPFGEIQASAQQLYVDGEALDQLLIDGQYKAQDSTIYGVSFKWQGANISGQAEQFEQGWSLINVTVNQLRLSQTSSIKKLLSGLNDLMLPVYHINSLDILNSDLHYAGWQFNQMDASLEDYFINRPLEQQKQASLSLSAESIDYAQLRLISPTARLNISDLGVYLDEFDADFKQGRIQMSGSLKQKQLQLNWLKISGVKWLEDSNQLLASLTEVFGSLESLDINELEIKNTQLIQVEQRPYWQLSGLNVEGKNLSLIRAGQSSLYQGSVEISANNASLDNLLTTQAIVNVAAKEGNIDLERAFLPLARGYIEASGRWQKQAISAPWQLTLHLDGLPVDLPLVQAQLPFQIIGMAEADASLEGLSGDYPILAHSLSGSIDLQLHQAALQVKDPDDTISYQQQWPLDTIKVSIDRGRIAMLAKGSNAELAGNIDLAKYPFGTLIFTSESNCKRLWSDILSQTNLVQEICSSKAEN
ncbi:hypothetical protein GCM10007938_41530 [Vibrio zhanjiangensis]|uniref:AsmA domain-containing protein n=1 Tax=Vibrio zhanjiangensis TaxID=1046128 RepID=A0ABQ6F544_9VIBR|nr:AsmA family protein [Vibrio zhanjiangensis]GLT20369.1 hypothetical protein GCM10007938_41530 [Vibrio zhanjiangensis]